MDAIPHILSTPIIPASYNVFWDEYAMQLQPRPLLILTGPMAAGGVEEGQLIKMLQASKLTPENYNIITLTEGEQVAWHKLTDTLTPKAVLLLGILPAQLGISALFRINEPNHFGSCIFIPTLSIAMLETRQDMKRQLWNSGLKPVFVDNSYGYL